MNFPVNATILDIVFIIFTILMLIIGYKRGIIVRIYNFLATILAFLLSIFLSDFLSDVFQLYTMDGLLSIVGFFINRMIVFGLVFVILKIIFFIVGKFVKPVIKAFVSKIPFVRTFNSLLGAILSLIQVLFISYLLLILSISPIFSNGKEVVNDTMVTKQVLKLAPSLSRQIMDMTDSFRMIEDMFGRNMSFNQTSPEGISSMLSTLSGMKDLNLLSDEEINAMVSNYMGVLDNYEGQITIDRQTYQTLQNLLDDIDNLPVDKEKIYEKIIVSE